MAFGSGKRTRSEIDPEIVVHSDSDNEAAHGDVRADADEGECESDCYQLEEDAEVEGKNDEVNPLYGEVNFFGGAPKGKNDGGSKQWECKHCKKKFKSSYTRMRDHLLGPKPGHKAQVSRCVVLGNDASRTKLLRDKVSRSVLHSYTPTVLLLAFFYFVCKHFFISIL
jgi:hypothetical protein